MSIKDLLNFGQVSKRYQRIASDGILWQKINLSWRRVPYKFIVKMVSCGTSYLSLSNACITHWGTKSKVDFLPDFSLKNQLKYLDLQDCIKSWCERSEDRFLAALVLSCHNLKKLSLKGCMPPNMTPLHKTKFIKGILQNGATLKVLSLCDCEGIF